MAEAQTNAPKYQAPKSAEELEAFRKKNPDLYDTVESVAHLQNEQQLADIRQELVSLKQREADIAKKEAEVELRQKHPDFEDLRGDERFHEWAKEQPEQIQGWLQQSNNASLAVKAIDLYKLEDGINSTQSTKGSPKLEREVLLIWFQLKRNLLMLNNLRFGLNEKSLKCP